MTKNSLKILIRGIGLFFVTVISTASVQASNFTVSPLFINIDAEARDIFTKDITLKNFTGTPTRIYATVHEVKVEEGAESTDILDFVPASMSDRTTSVTSWIEITRARLEVPAEGELVVPLRIKINPEVKPGKYHALIGFATGKNTDEIEKKVKAGQGWGVLLTIVIEDKKAEGMHLVSFVTSRFVYQPENNQIKFTLENTGDFPITPKGEVIIYDTTGKELTTVVANSANMTLEPGERKEVVEELPFTNRLGRNKAYLNLEYGNNLASVSDTAFYYSMPWYYVIGIFALLILLLTMVALLFRRSLSHETGFEKDIIDLPLFVKQGHDHAKYEHDIDLKNDNNT